MKYVKRAINFEVGLLLFFVKISAIERYLVVTTVRLNSPRRVTDQALARPAS
jgi:hypothetical protein